MAAAVEHHYGAETVGFVERDAYAQRILRRHWPDVPIFDDIRECGAHNLPACDILEGGSPCVDLSTAGRQAGLHADRSGLFFDFVRIAAELQPRIVLLENVPALLSKWRGTVERAFADAGYGCTWTKVAAAHAGAPHLRWRVFVLAELGGRHKGVCAELPVPDVRAWPTPVASVSVNDGESPESWHARYARNGTGPGTTLGLGTAIRMERWPSPTATFMDPVDVESWEARRQRDLAKRANGNGQGTPLGIAVRTDPNGWRPERRATPTTQDGSNNGGDSQHERNTLPLNAQVNGRLNAEWVEALQGMPIGWTDPDGEAPIWQPCPCCDNFLCAVHGGHAHDCECPDLETYDERGIDPYSGGATSLRPAVDMSPRWPAPRGCAQHPWEPPRLVEGKQPNRSKRLKALGNLVPPQQVALALRLLERGPQQQSLFAL